MVSHNDVESAWPLGQAWVFFLGAENTWCSKLFYLALGTYIRADESRTSVYMTCKVTEMLFIEVTYCTVVTTDI